MTKNLFQFCLLLLLLLELMSLAEAQVCFQNITRPMNVKRDNRFVKANITTTIKVCCEGYERDPKEKSRCKPICEEGFSYAKGQCIPKCDNCELGECLSPQNCKCNNEGYSWSADRGCGPICPENCGNGECHEPGVCKCLPGFHYTAAEGCVAVENNRNDQITHEEGQDDSNGPEIEGYIRYFGKKLHFIGHILKESK
ncbi:epidermal growth factor-like protein [Musca vetustissima]|uniref:epidermal growth factor-like protein n=1 Tax=Musca vetustissima TaxID=27455 RepID=UPI002AB6801D|nr:epidermal growth factor-like protein [Musca vetustissima]